MSESADSGKTETAVAPPPPPPPSSPLKIDKDPLEFERRHVHHVYDEIANHFSATRYKAWPKVRAFVESLPAGSVMADVGCGNGKNLCLSDKVCAIGCDRSANLVSCARGQNLEAFRCDGLAVPMRRESCDAAISIAVIHHFATDQRRQDAVVELLKLLRPGGKALIYVWAKEQKKDRGPGTDVMIKWELHSKFDESNTVHQRYYHLFVKGELETLCEGAIAAMAAQKESNSTTAAEEGEAKAAQGSAEEPAKKVEEPPVSPEFSIESSYFDKENWCIILKRKEAEGKAEV